MAEVIGEEGIRVRFAWQRAGEAAITPAAQSLARAIAALDRAGLCPVLDDGLSAGNAAVRDGNGVWVTPSGRRPGAFSDPRLNAEAMVHVAEFDAGTWSASGRGPRAATPSSDTPLHWLALIESPSLCGWPRAPRVALHGHALDDDASAAALGAPISGRETLFSTPADRQGLLDLLRAHPYPAHRLWIRRGHGFFLVADELDAALAALDALVQRREKMSTGL